MRRRHPCEQFFLFVFSLCSLRFALCVLLFVFFALVVCFATASPFLTSVVLLFVVGLESVGGPKGCRAMVCGAKW
jgi:hypothetical protein